MAKNKANNVKNQPFPRYLDLFFYFCTIVNSNQSIDTIQSGLPRPVLDASFAVMIAAAVCSHHSIQEWLLNHAPIPFAILTTLGMVIIYYAFLRGMKTLHHPLTVLWWITIAANILGFLIVCLGDKFHGVSAIVATFLPLIYLPLGGGIVYLVPWAAWPGRPVDGDPYPCTESGAGPVLCDRPA